MVIYIMGCPCLMSYISIKWVEGQKLSFLSSIISSITVIIGNILFLVAITYGRDAMLNYFLKKENKPPLERSDAFGPMVAFLTFHNSFLYI